MQKILVTGAAGFIGFHLVKRLLKEGFEVIGLDNINDYYDINLKYARLAETGIYAPEETDHSGGKNRIYQEIRFAEILKSVTSPNYRFISLNRIINNHRQTDNFSYICKKRNERYHG